MSSFNWTYKNINSICIGGTNTSGLGIKSGTKLLGSNGKSKAALRNRLSGVKLLIINEFSMKYGQILNQG